MVCLADKRRSNCQLLFSLRTKRTVLLTSSPMSCPTIPYHITPHHTIPYQTIPYHIAPYHTIPHHTITYDTIPSTPYYSIPGLPCSTFKVEHSRPYHTAPIQSPNIRYQTKSKYTFIWWWYVNPYLKIKVDKSISHYHYHTITITLLSHIWSHAGSSFSDRSFTFNPSRDTSGLQ